jgi:hypothetical protein
MNFHVASGTSRHVLAPLTDQDLIRSRCAFDGGIHARGIRIDYSCAIELMLQQVQLLIGVTQQEQWSPMAYREDPGMQTVCHDDASVPIKSLHLCEVTLCIKHGGIELALLEKRPRSSRVHRGAPIMAREDYGCVWPPMLSGADCACDQGWIDAAKLCRVDTSCHDDRTWVRALDPISKGGEMASKKGHVGGDQRVRSGQDGYDVIRATLVTHGDDIGSTQDCLP